MAHGFSRPVTFGSLLAALLATGCTRDGAPPLFRLLSPDQTGIAFANVITTSDSLNIQTDVYIYNGSGVAVGDIDNDGLSDLFFTGNMVSSRLYLNKGQMRFDDVTERAGVATRRWSTGATMVDINNDGHLDIYVSVSGPEWSKPQDRVNALFINNGDRTFTEAASQYGIADTGFTTHAVFLDYDRDGCLDLFVLNNSPQDFSRGEVIRLPLGRRGQTPGSYNQLYRNNCRGSFSNVSTAVGIKRDVGYGLGVVVSDLNRDGWPDIYVSNDATPNDVIYVNNRDGTFSDRAGQWLKHASLAGMGVDIADFNNDGWPDILQVDMMPSDLARRKRMSGAASYSSLLESRGRGFRDDYSVNTLQLSSGLTKDGALVFSDIASLAGVGATDWSWSALFADFDNDGQKDIFISNGYPKAANDYDYQNAMFAIRRRANDPGAKRTGLELLERLHAYRVPNHVFRNAGDLTFTDLTDEWGMNTPSLSYGAAYGDLDNNGTLDLVVSNIDAQAFVYQNVAAPNAPGGAHWLQLRLVGEPPHQRGGIGAQLTLTAGGRKQYVYHTPYRGYMSTMDDRAHFGLGAAPRVDTLEILWPDGRYQLLTNLDGDRLIVVKQSDAVERRSDPTTVARRGHFEAMKAPRGLEYRHETGSNVDYSIQPLLPYMISRQGAVLAVGDVDRDGRDDVFIGGGSGVAARLLLQQPDGRFTAAIQPWGADRVYEDWGARFFDANGDGLLDLYVASGGYQLAPGSPLLQDRLYINQGDGRFARDAQALPAMLTSTGAVSVGDFSGDGRPDLFIGGRLTPRKYPYPTRSYLLRNDGGRFTDVTADLAPELVQSGGMITDAVFIDFDGDRRLDLVTVGEWMAIQFYRNEGARFRNVTRSTRLPPLRGWWYSLAAGDFDADGRDDLVAGNLGLNYLYSTSSQSRFGVYAGDFDANQITDVILTQEIDGTEHPVAGLVPLGREIYTLAPRFPTFESFSTASMRDLFTARQLEEALHYQVDTFASMFLRNDGEGVFTARELPNLAQIAPIRTIVVEDVDADGHLDLIVAGNIYDVEPNVPRLDAGNGLWLRGDGRGNFAAIPPAQSGLLTPKDVAGLAVLKTPGGKVLLVANTGDSLQVFTMQRR